MKPAVASPVPPALLGAIAGHASARPHAPAVWCEGVALSYFELEQRSSRLAAQLLAGGVGPGTVIAFDLPRSAALVVAAVATLKTGAAYLPLDPGTPMQRLRWQLEDSGATRLLVPAGTDHSQLAGAWQTMEIDPVGNSELTGSAGGLDTDRLDSERLAYVIYTSGSTGLPKGAEITVANVHWLVDWHREAFDVTPLSRAAMLASPAFDASVWETWPYLCAGSCLHVPPDNIRLDAAALRDWLFAEQITHCFLPPSLAETLLDLAWPEDTALRFLLTGAEPLRRRPQRPLPFRLVNNYGLTECTVVTTSGEVSPGAGQPSIGRPLPHARVYILDAERRPVAPGTAGELYVGGACVGVGYRRRPELTRERFLHDPFSTNAGRMYRTGDLGRLLPTGEIEFIGRSDDQIKIRGHRVEPNEVVAALNRQPMVQASAVVAHSGLAGETRLIAYVVCSPGTAFSPRTLREFLAASLPDYMLPAKFIRLNALPLTTQGKLDRGALPEPSEPSGNDGLQDEGYLAPRTAVEEDLSRIVAELMGIERVGIHDNFFLLGGHSLLGAQLIARLEQHFGISLPLLEVFDAPSIEALAVAIESRILTKLGAESERGASAAAADDGLGRKAG